MPLEPLLLSFSEIAAMSPFLGPSSAVAQGLPRNLQQAARLERADALPAGNYYPAPRRCAADRRASVSGRQSGKVQD